MNVALDLTNRLQQKVSFSMIQSLKMLQVNTLQLEEMLKAELEQNPLLEIEDDMDLALDANIEIESETNSEDDRGSDDEYLEELKSGDDDDNDDIDWEEYFESGFDLGESFSEERDPNEEHYESSTVYEETLEERLTSQLAEKKIEERVRILVQYLIGSLDDDGYLRIPVKDLAEYAEVSIGEVEDALGVLWKFEPAGIGARDLRECMILQLRAFKMENSVAMKIVADYWNLFERLKILELGKHLNVEPREIQEAINFIKTLDPKPGHQFNVNKSSAIIPDLIVEKIDGKFMVIINDRSIPSLCINKSYADMIKRGSKAQKDVKEYVREKFNSASWFIKSIEQRRTTMLKVMYAIIERQKLFFEKGPPNIVPLMQKEVAEMIGMHFSTVSRVTSNKYVQTQYGIFELKYFFPVEFKKPGDKGEDEDTASSGGADVTAERIKRKIKQLIENEDPKSPISDQKISEILEKENLPAARRTVAKYREQMKIPTTRLRQKYD